VSTITTSMTRLQLLNTQSSRQFNILNRYLGGHDISVELKQRIQRNAEFAIDEMRRNVPESSVELLQLLSRPVRIELDYEVHSPLVCRHPFFGFYRRKNPAGIRQVCHTAISRLTISKGDVLFSDGEIPEEPKMFFLLSGSLQYRRISCPLNYVCPMQWGCEACLWVSQWAHHGSCSAMSDCRLICLSAERFQGTASQFKRLEFFPAMYAEEFVRRLNLKADDKTNFTELHDDEFVNLQDVVNEIDPSYVPDVGHTSSGGGGHIRASIGSWRGSWRTNWTSSGGKS